MFTDFKKIIELIKRTGDKFIFQEADEDFVVMKVEEYEKLLASKTVSRELRDFETEEELIEKINSEISDWREMQSNDDNLPEFSNNIAVEKEEGPAEDQYYLEPVD